MSEEEVKKERPRPRDLNFTDRQKEVLRLLADDYTVQEIADKTDRTFHSVKQVTRDIRTIAGVKNITAAVALALRLGIIL